ncbi:glycoside hydrolase family 36 N-terminal domain-containing protein [Sphingomonas silueang]|uniref:glycoside hydrolase family 36 N-terminal domain-containing protein n=1 Tax=Sphingomonas silueang TaxID=3156617 RepID=UPI0032B44773
MLRYRGRHVAGETLAVDFADTGMSLRIEQLAAAVFTLPAGNDYRLTCFGGRHAVEWTRHDTAIGPAATVTERRRGLTTRGSRRVAARR